MRLYTYTCIRKETKKAGIAIPAFFVVLAFS